MSHFGPLDPLGGQAQHSRFYNNGWDPQPATLLVLYNPPRTRAQHRPFIAHSDGQSNHTAFECRCQLPAASAAES